MNYSFIKQVFAVLHILVVFSSCYNASTLSIVNDIENDVEVTIISDQISILKDTFWDARDSLFFVGNLIVGKNFQMIDCDRKVIKYNGLIQKVNESELCFSEHKFIAKSNQFRFTLPLGRDIQLLKVGSSKLKLVDLTEIDSIIIEGQYLNKPFTLNLLGEAMIQEAISELEDCNDCKITISKMLKN